MIEGVVVKPLKRICDERGSILKMQESTDDEFLGFGEIYFSTIYPNVVKGWHLHLETTLNYTVVSGMIKLVLYDDREYSSTKGTLMEIFMGEDNYILVQIPKGIWNGFKCIGNKTAIVADLTNLTHNPNDMVRMDPIGENITGYDWSLKNR